MRSTLLSAFATLFLATTLAACGAPSATDDGVVGDVEGKADSAGSRKRASGYYRGSPVEAGQFTYLELRTDGSYRAARLVYCITTPCNPVEEYGSWSTARSTLTLTSDGGSVSDYSYKLATYRDGGKDLWLTHDGRTQQLTAKPGTPCGAGTCGAGEVCCNSSCGICTPPDGFCIQLACSGPL